MICYGTGLEDFRFYFTKFKIETTQDQDKSIRFRIKKELKSSTFCQTQNQTNLVLNIKTFNFVIVAFRLLWSFRLSMPKLIDQSS